MKDALQAYLEHAIPLVGAMRCTVASASADEVVITAPLAPNVNHQGTAFGGSIAALATLACWGWLWGHIGVKSDYVKLVVARSEIDYVAPLSTHLVARCRAPDEAARSAFDRAFSAKGRARIALSASVEDDVGKVCARFRGAFAARRSR